MRQLRSLTGQVVAVTLDGDTDLLGTVDEVGKDCLILRDTAAAGHDGGQPQPMDGLVAVPWGRIVWVQAP